jgi:hypothetical protein
MKENISLNFYFMSLELSNIGSKILIKVGLGSWPVMCKNWKFDISLQKGDDIIVTSDALSLNISVVRVAQLET